ncbi:hypothetical protein CCUS01_14932 [Colletotrichum cuscutae]|uniref:Uncharacterized protein n=1 Tax=Colletotrichum cuscutae TaxID=1209917 RepID=A0AAI9Y6C5_9PEZI|nr:hypothetical protein CCUS01_14932 [Colletotrichum cuscutae]
MRCQRRTSYGSSSESICHTSSRDT